MSRELNATAASVLGFLQDGPKTGWDIASDVEKVVGNFWNVTRSQVYRELRNLEAAGLVEPGETGPRERRPYEITSAGRQTFLTWLREVPGRDMVRIPLLLKLVFAESLETPVLEEFVRVHLDRHRELLAEYTALLVAVADTMPSICHVLRYGIAHEQAVVGWLGALPWAESQK